MKISKALFPLLVVGLLIGCTQSDVDTVKGGTMNGYRTTSVGAAFEASFDNPKWSAFKGEKGQRVVEFTGTISKTLNKSAVSAFEQFLAEQETQLAHAYPTLIYTMLGNIPEHKRQIFSEMAGGKTEFERDESVVILARWHEWEPGLPVVFQWIISPDGKTFSLAYVESAKWEGIKTDYILDMIYR